MLARFTARAGVALVLLPLALLALVFLRRSPSPPPTIVLILIDTLRADRLAAYGNTRGLTPFLDQLAGSGTLFRHAYSTTSWTSPAVASLFTSRFPSQHRITSYESKLAADEIRLATRLRQAGYTSAAFVANSQISKPRGFAEGFTYWWEAQSARPGAADVRRAVSAWLDDAKTSRRGPFFLYVHFLDPHAPYLPPEPYRSRFANAETRANASKADAKMMRRQWGTLTRAEVDLLESLYDGEVASVDGEIRLLVTDLERRGLLAHAVVVVTADHGEEFMEHGGMNHGRTLYDEVIHVPLIVAMGGRLEGRVIGENVSLVDVAPTLLELAGATAEPRFEGRSLVRLLEASARSGEAGRSAESPQATGRSGCAETSGPRAIVGELLPNGSAFDLRHHARAIVEGSAKVLISVSGAAEFYDLEEDPGETSANTEGAGQGQHRLMVELDDAEHCFSSRAGSATGAVPLDAAARENLRALGYEPPGP